MIEEYPVENTTDQTNTETLYKAELVETVISIIIFALVSSIGTLFNGLLISAILLSRKLRSTAGSIIVALSFNDFVLCLIFYPLHIYGTVFQAWETSFIICQMTAVILPICTFETIIAFPMVAYNRYVYVAKSRDQYMKIFSKKATSLLIISSWLFPSMLVGFPLLTSFPIFVFSPVYHMCIYQTYDWTNYLEFIIFSLCFTVTVGSYYKLIRYIRTHVRDIRTTLVTTAQLKTRKLDIQAIKMMTFVSCGFCACCFPYLVARVIDPSLSHLPAFVHKVCLLILAIGSILNPMMYTVTNSWHQKAIGCLLRFKLPDSDLPNNLAIA